MVGFDALWAHANAHHVCFPQRICWPLGHGLQIPIHLCKPSHESHTIRPGCKGLSWKGLCGYNSIFAGHHGDFRYCITNACLFRYLLIWQGMMACEADAEPVHCIGPRPLTKILRCPGHSCSCKVAHSFREGHLTHTLIHMQVLTIQTFEAANPLHRASHLARYRQ